MFAISMNYSLAHPSYTSLFASPPSLSSHLSSSFSLLLRLFSSYSFSPLFLSTSSSHSPPYLSLSFFIHFMPSFSFFLFYLIAFIFSDKDCSCFMVSMPSHSEDWRNIIFLLLSILPHHLALCRSTKLSVFSNRLGFNSN